MAVPADSAWHDSRLPPGETGEVVECEPDTWLDAAGASKVVSLTEQQLGQDNDFSMLMLVAEMCDEHGDSSRSGASTLR
jgi:hypothetical protein